MNGRAPEGDIFWNDDLLETMGGSCWSCVFGRVDLDCALIATQHRPRPMSDHEPTEVRPFRFGLLAFVGMAVVLVAVLAFILARPRTPSRVSLELDRKLARLRKD